MFLKELRLTSFRNYQDFHHVFDKLKTIIIGPNAQGKSNILEAINILACSKSARAQKDNDLISWGNEYSIIFAKISTTEQELEIALLINPSGKRRLKINGVAKKAPQADLLGNFFNVIFSCEDLYLIKGSPSIRRDWMDSLLLQIEPTYNKHLKAYEKSISQKNALFKKSFEMNLSQRELKNQLDIWNESIISSGTEIISSRINLMLDILPVAQKFQKDISQNTENLNLTYVTNIFKSIPGNTLSYSRGEIKDYFIKALELSFPEEYARGQSVIGPHRDDILFSLNEKDAKSFASQGQQRSIILALKLSEVKLIEQRKNEVPVLLLDDVFAELDTKRQDFLLHNLPENIQTIITTTHISDLQSDLLKNANVIKIEGGKKIEETKV